MRTLWLRGIVTGLMACALLLPMSVSAWGERGSAGILTDVESESGAVWIDYERHAVDARTKVYDHRGRATDLEGLEPHIEQEVSYVVREDGRTSTLVVLRVLRLIED